MKAFPSEKKLYWLFRQGDKPIPNDVIEQGMDLRDYFAAHIIQGLVANHTTCDDDEVVIKSAWGLANKMIKARNDS